MYGVNQGGLICGDTGGNKSFKVVQFVALSNLYNSSIKRKPFGSLFGLRGKGTVPNPGLAAAQVTQLEEENLLFQAV